MNTINTSLSKLSAAKTFFNKDIKGLKFNDYQSLYNALLSTSDGFYKQSLNYIIINDIYDYAPSYVDLYALCNFLKESISIDGLIMLYFDISTSTISKPNKQAVVNRIIGNHEGTRKDNTLSFKIGSATYHIKVPKGFVYDIPFKDIILNIDKIRSELSDNIIRYDNYLNILQSYFNVINTVLTEQYIILSLTVKDD